MNVRSLKSNVYILATSAWWIQRPIYRWEKVDKIKVKLLILVKKIESRFILRNKRTQKHNTLLSSNFAEQQQKTFQIWKIMCSNKNQDTY